MPLKKEREELSHKTVEELAIALRAAKEDMFKVRTNIATRKAEDNNRSKVLRRHIARLRTYMNRKRQEQTGAAGAGPGSK